MDDAAIQGLVEGLIVDIFKQVRGRPGRKAGREGEGERDEGLLEGPLWTSSDS